MATSYDAIRARIRQQRQGRYPDTQPTLASPAANPFATGEKSAIGGFIESAFSAIPELFGSEPADAAVAFRAAHPIAGLASQIIPTMVPYAGAYSLSRTALGAATLNRGMQGVKSVGQAAGLNVVNRPVVSGAVKEMLRYSPVELGRLGVGAAINPENAGELFADVALSTAFAGVFGGVGGYLRAGGSSPRPVGSSPIEGQNNMFAHPVVDLRAARAPEAKTVADEISIEAAETQLTKEVLNDAPVKGYLSKKIVPVVSGIVNGTERTSSFVNALLGVNSRGSKARAFDRRKLWEGDEADNITLNAGELQPIVTKLGFETPTDLAENVLTARVFTLNSDRPIGNLAQQFDDTAFASVGKDAFVARTDTGATFILKKIDNTLPEGTPTPVAKKIGAELDPPSPVQEIVDGGPAPLTVVESKGVRNAGGGGLTHQVKLSDGSEVKIFRDTDQFGTPVWHLDSDGLPGKYSDYGAMELALGSTKAEALEAVGEKVARLRGVTPAVTTPTSALSKKAKSAAKFSRQVSEPPAPTHPFRVGDRWAAILTDRPGAFIKDLEKLNATNKEQWATMRRMFQPVGEANQHVFNRADDALLATVTPLDVARMSRQSRKTWVAETAKSLAQRGLRAGGLTDNHTLQNYADHLYDVFAPAMFKERRNTLYARYSGVLTNRLRVVNEKVNEAMFGREGLKAGARGTLGRNFERQQVDGQMSFREAVDQLTDEELDVVVKALVTQTPAKEIKKLAKDGVISENAIRAVERMQTINASFMTDNVLPALKSLGEKGNFDLLEGYVIPRILMGDWRMPVKTEGGQLIYLASGKTRGQAERMAKAIVDEAKDRGQVYVADKATLKHAVEMNVEDVTDLLEDVGRKIDSDPDAADIVASAMKRVQFMNVKRQARLPYNPRVPGSLAHERSGIKGTDATYTREEFIKAFESHIRKMGNFAAVHSFMERWGHEIQGLRGQNQTLYNDVMRRAQQAMGVEGQITRVINEKLSSFLGPQMGSKAGTKIAAAANKTLYAWQLAFVNPTFALLNALSPIQTVLPQLSFVMSAPRAEANRLLHHVPIIDSTGKVLGKGAFMEPVKILGEAVRQLRHADDELKHIHVRLRNDNTLHPMLFEEHVGAGASNPETLREAFKSGGWAKFLIEGSTVMARKSEEFARIVSANAGYIVGRNQLGLEGEQLYHFTKRFVESTNYLYGQSDRARLITGPVGSMFGLFKNWQMHFMGMMATYAGLAINRGVFAPLMWQVGAAASLGGIGATPLKNVADGLSNWYADNPDSYLWMQENWGSTAADVTYFGPMGGLGISLQASSSIPGTDVRNEMQGLMNSVVWERGKQIGKAVGDSYSYAKATGQNPLTNANLRDQIIAATAPRAVSRAVSVAEGEYVRSMGTGYPQVQDVSFGGRLAHGMGLNAVEIEKHQVAARRLFKEQEARKADITQHGRAFAAAEAAGDNDTMHQVLISATARELDLDSVLRSSDNFIRREDNDLLGRYKDDSSYRYREAFGQ
jgi:1,2-phenylacetyl-CoA epoxidase catalytic subunit